MSSLALIRQWFCYKAQTAEYLLSDVSKTSSFMTY